LWKRNRVTRFLRVCLAFAVFYVFFKLHFMKIQFFGYYDEKIKKNF